MENIKTFNVLIVDDSLYDLKEIKKTVNIIFPYAKIHSYSHEISALEYLNKNPDTELLISDVFLEEEDGYSFALKVRKICPDIKIVFITGNLAAIIAMESKVDYLTIKTSDMQELRAILSKIKGA